MHFYLELLSSTKERRKKSHLESVQEYNIHMKQSFYLTPFITKPIFKIKINTDFAPINIFKFYK